MAWAVEFTDSAGKEFLSLPKPVREKVSQKLRLLQENPFPPGCVKLKNYEDLFRIRVGLHYRVIYFARAPEQTILVARVRHRRHAYRGL